jgi:hypothetical protein
MRHPHQPKGILGMKWPPRIPKRLTTLARLASVPAFLLSFGMAVRTACIGTNDLFHFGQGESWWCYAIINFRQASASLEVYDPNFHGGFIGVPKGEWFYSHLAAQGGIWSVRVPPEQADIARSHDFGVYKYYDMQVHGHPIYSQHILELGPLFPVLLLVSSAVIGLWARERWRARRNRTASFCPYCRYDLRAHHCGDKCPECGTVFTG